MVTNFLQGIGTFGALQAGPNPAGAVLFVNAATGADNRGRVSFPGASASTTNGSTQGPQVDPSKPLATINYALSFTKANRGDVVVVMEGHTEVLSASTGSITMTVDGVSIIGLGQGDKRPAITTAGYSITITANSCRVSNLIMLMGTNPATFGTVFTYGGSAGTVIDNMRIVSANVTSVGIRLGSSNCTIADNELDGTTVGFDKGIYIDSAQDNIVITGNRIHGIFATACIDVGASTNTFIARNQLIQKSASVDAVISGVVTASSGLVMDNRFVSAHAATPAAYLAGANVATNTGVVYLQNYGFTNKAGPSSGILVPAVGTIP